MVTGKLRPQRHTKPRNYVRVFGVVGHVLRRRGGI
eukprot:SAG22_NODE_13825_length_393_cov_1.482993_1_plen_34_part_10